MTTRAKNAIAIVATTIVVSACIAYVKRTQDLNRFNSYLSQFKYDTKAEAKTIGTVLFVYSSDNDDCLPPEFATTIEWQKALKPYSKNIHFESMNPAGGSIVPNNLVAGAGMQYELDRDSAIAFEEK